MVNNTIVTAVDDSVKRLNYIVTLLPVAKSLLIGHKHCVPKIMIKETAVTLE